MNHVQDLEGQLNRVIAERDQARAERDACAAEAAALRAALQHIDDSTVWEDGPLENGTWPEKAAACVHPAALAEGREVLATSPTAWAALAAARARVCEAERNPAWDDYFSPTERNAAKAECQAAWAALRAAEAAAGMTR